MTRNLKLVFHFLILFFTTWQYSSAFNDSDTLYFDTSISDDATSKVLEKTLDLEAKIRLIKFQKGEYHFYPDKGYETFCRISNHDDLMVKTAFPVNKWKNVTIDGQGATFIFHGIMIPFLIDHSENITIKNVSIDWAVSFHSEMTVVANNINEKSFDVNISKEYPYEIRNGQLIFIKEYYEHSLGQTILYDSIRRAIAFNTHAYTPLTTSEKSESQFNLDNVVYKYKKDVRSKFFKKIGKQEKLKAKEIKPGLVRIYNHKKGLPPVGFILTAKGDQSINRVAPAFRLTWNTNFKAQNVTVHHAGGMGLIAENCENVSLNNFNVTPSRGRIVSTTADATHFVGCRGVVELLNCTFENQLDDASNIHGAYQEIVDILGPKKLGIRMGHSQQQGFIVGKKGDNLGLVRLSNSFFPYKNVTIENIKTINGRYHILTTKENLPKDLKVGDLVENTDAYPKLIVKNCQIKNNRARGLLLSTPKGAIIENNFFGTQMEALLIPVESGFWFESGNAQDIVIKNNTFQDCQHSGFKRGVIRFDTDDDNKSIAFKNIKIIKNTFNHFDNLILQLTNTDGLEFSGNTINNSGTFPQLFPKNPVIRIFESKNLTFKNNTYKGKAKTIFEGKDTKSLKL